MTIIAYYLLLQLLLINLFKRNSSILYCGIFGFSGFNKITKEQAKSALNKIKILGLLSYPSRGRDGCGIYYNKTILRGTKQGSLDTTEFDDFLMNPDEVLPAFDAREGNVIIGHVRAASLGTAKIDSNIHPFHIKGATSEDDIIFLHNGTIDNPWQMCEKHGIDHVGEHINLDSKALGTLIARVGTSVLEEYKGAAALLWTKPSEPNSLYVFHGGSYKFKSDKAISEERPLYHMKTDEGIYFASEARFLNAIRETDKQIVEEFIYNRVIKFTNGKTDGPAVVINREEANLWTSPINTPTTQQGSRIGPSYPATQNRNIITDVRSNSNIRKRNAGKGGGSGPKTPSTNLVWNELAPKETLSRSGKNYVSFYKGRYHLPNGVFPSNLLWIKDRGIVVAEGEPEATAYWFWSGVLLKNKEAYETLVKESNQTNSWVNSPTENYAAFMSRFSMYPVCNLETECINESTFFRYSWYYSEKRVHSETFTPLFSGRSYKIAKGFLTEITSSDSDDKVFPETKNNDLSVFDIIFEKIDEVHLTMSNVELSAMERYVEDTLRQEWNQVPLIQETQQQMWMLVRTAIAGGMTIRHAFKDTDGLLEIYAEDIHKHSETDGYPAKINFVESVETADEYDSLQDAYRAMGKITQTHFSTNLNIRKASKIEAAVDAESDFTKDDDMPWEYPDDEALKDAYVEDYKLMMSEQEIDKEILKFENNREKENHRLAVQKVGELIDTIQEVATVSDELNAMIDSDYATDAAQIVRNSIEDVKHKLGEVCEVNHDPESLMRLNQIVNS